jgi:hypothetical protein
VSPKGLREDIEFALGEIDQELEATTLLFKLAERGELDTVYTIAGAAVLHSIYSGLESIFAMIQKRIDGRQVDSGQWHRVLLANMSKATASRPAVISLGCRAQLKDYLAFRHRFRHSYGWSLDPAIVAIKLRQLPSVLDLARSEILSFLSKIEGAGEAQV